jgi:GAF domain-containing protein
VLIDGNATMLDSMAERLRRCTDIQSVLDCLLNRSLELNHAGLGNIQLMNWRAGYLEIKVQRGFGEEFLNFFERVKLEDSSACARALRTREAVVIEDVIVDRQFAPCLENRAACRYPGRALYPPCFQQWGTCRHLVHAFPDAASAD